MAMTFSNTSSITIDGAWTNPANATITFWVFINTLNTFTNRFIGSDSKWEVRAGDGFTGDWRFLSEFYSSDVDPALPAISTTIVQANTWYHIATTVDSSLFHTIYVNGVLEGSQTGLEVPTGTTLSIGDRFGGPANQCTNGILEDMRVYTRVLSADEIATIYACRGTDTIVQGLQNRWLLNEGAEGVVASGAGIIKDLTGSQNGTPVNSPTWTGSRLKLLRNNHRNR